MDVSRRSLLIAGATMPFVGLSAKAAQSPGQLTFGLSNYPSNMTPWTNTGASAAGLKLLMYRGLLSYDDQGQLRGELAEKWEREGDSTWIFHLRDAVFHNGKPVTSADVKWSFEQVTAAKSTAYLKDDIGAITKIETPDAKTVRLITAKAVATLPQTLASAYSPIIQRESMDNGGQPAGAGPYRMTNQERGVSLEMTAFEHYYRPGLPKLKTLRFIAYADENLRVSALKAGDVDLIEYVPWPAMESIEAQPALALDGTMGPFMYLTFNGTTGPFKDAKVRLAAAHAIKRDQLVSAAFYGRGAPLAGLPIPPSSPFFDKARSVGWAYDPAKSKALLAEAGMPNGFSCTLLSTAQYGMMKDTAEIVQQNLADVGIQAKLFLPDWGGRIAAGNRGQYEIAIGGTATDSNDPDALGALIDGSLPMSYQRSCGINNPELTELLAQGRAEFDQAKRKAIYDKVQDVTLAQASFVGLAWRSQGYAMNKALKGFKNLPGALTFYSTLTLEEANWA
jgi:peptide/nickel transport system substrate-binding protein